MLGMSLIYHHDDDDDGNDSDFGDYKNSDCM